MTARPSFRARVAFEEPKPTPAQRFAAACDLHDMAVEMVAARFVRENPGASDEEVLGAVAAWLAAGDPGPGRVRS